MERLRKTRAPIRRSITRTINQVEAALAVEEQDKDSLHDELNKLQSLRDRLRVLDHDIIDKMLDDNKSVEEIEEEHLQAEEYEDKLRTITRKLSALVLPQGRPVSPTGSDYSTASSGGGKKKTNYKLPKIEIKKFDGELTGWLSFWSQFQKIHEDEELHASDKFQYLVQSMVKGTRAADLVHRYPQTAENYPKVIKALQERFGDKKLLGDVYARELLKMALSNVNSREKIELSKLYDKLETNLRALESMGVAAESPHILLLPMVESSLPEEVLRAWQRSPLSSADGTQENPPRNPLDYLMEFLRREVQNEEKISLAKGGFALGEERKDKDKTRKSAFRERTEDGAFTAAGLHSGQEAKSCLFCNKINHASHECYIAKKMTLAEKSLKIRELKRCFVCWRHGHRAGQCTSNVKCEICSGRHYTIMCPDNSRNKKPEVAATTSVNTNKAGSGLVLLKTLVVTMKVPKGERQLRVLFDDGSQRSYIRREVAMDGRCKAIGSLMERNSLFGGVLTDVEKRTIYVVRLKSLDKKASQELELMDKPRIAGDIPRIPWGEWSRELMNKKICLTDYQSNDEEIDVLIGSDLIPRLSTGKTIKLKGGMLAVETVFGWTVMGPVPVKKEKSAAMAVTTSLLSSASVSQLWDLETLGIRDPAEAKSVQDKETEVRQHFQENLTRNENGNYCVRLPWIGGVQDIPSNKEVALKRLESATTKLVKENRFDDYDRVFKEWEKEGIIGEVDELEEVPCHYIPHRPVFKPESKTTPVRPVFDASCKVGRNPSLNECLEKGPNLIELIPSIMLRFREKKIGVISDIRKAFQMIEVSTLDRDYLRFLWWEDLSRKKIKIYRHHRVVFGLNCSPFLLGAVLEQHLSQVGEKDKIAAEKLQESIYVDNCVLSVDTMQDYEAFKMQSVKILKDAGMELRQWECGSTGDSRIGLNQGCRLEYGGSPTFQESSNDSTTVVLGMAWDKDEDSLRCCAVPQVPDKLTKRSILSTVQKIFDPMGILCPAMLTPKCLLQEAWGRKMGWDEEIPSNVRNEFEKWAMEMKCLEDIRIPRNMTNGNSARESWQIHVFCDASQDGYAAAVFLRTGKDEVSVQLLQAKSRVAPLKKMSIPRLELMGCTIAARLEKSVRDALKLEVPTTFWSDSSTALAWIKGNDEWGTFVGNRVREINNLTNPQNWRHVPGVINPADLPSRGCTPRELLESKWWEGPNWLKLAEAEWPHQKFTEDRNEILAEVKAKKVNTLENQSVMTDPWYGHFSSFASCVRVVAWIRRFLNKTRKISHEKGELSRDEICSAEKQIFRMIQKESFSDKEEVIGGIRVEREGGLICAKTKLLHRQDPQEFKWPVLLPHTHPMVDKLIWEEHHKYKHAGIQLLMSKLREKCWIIRSRKAIRRIVRSCVICKRFRSRASAVPVAPLPEDRVKNCRVFEVTGVDLAGPLFLKSGTKAWIVLFTCAVYRAVHLELVSSLSTDTFLLALFRFISRRGRPSIIYSDNGTNFVGAANLFKMMDWKKIERETKVDKIQWKFNPPAAPWWGGFWERMVQSVKDLLRKMLGHKKLNLVQLETCLCEVEAIVNARPLTYVTEDQDDLIPLTPAMFMQDNFHTESYEIETLNAVGFRKKYKDLVQLKEELRARFRAEYLGLLVQRGKATTSRTFKVGEVVYIGSDDKKRLAWPLGRIIELMPGKDGNVRVARVKTSSGNLLRPLQRLIPLEVGEELIPEKVRAEAKRRQEMSCTRDKKEVITRFGRKIKSPKRFGYDN